jgi:hypothetical protein
MVRVIATLAVLGLALPLGGCVYGPGYGHGWCYWHPYRCR